MTVTVENATWRGKPCYLVHANSHGSVDQVPIGTSVTGTVQVQAWRVLLEFLCGDVSLRLWTPQPVLDLVQMNLVTLFESLCPKYQGFLLFLFDFSLQFPFVSYDESQFFCDCIKPEMDKGSKNLIPINILSLFFQLMLEEHFRHLNKLTMNMSRYIICEIAAFVNESLFHQ